MSKFEGFEPANTTPVPDILFDELLSELTGTELKVLLYIIRRTSGFKKATDAISLSQLQNGIVTKDGKVLDKGCGVKRRDTIVDALASLEKKGCIMTHKGKTPKRDHATTIYSIRFKGDKVVTKPDYPPSHQTGLPLVTKPDYGSHQTGLPVVTKPDPQETVIQETVIQEKESTSAESANPSASSPSSTHAPSSTQQAHPIATTATRNVSFEALSSEQKRIASYLEASDFDFDLTELNADYLAKLAKKVASLEQMQSLIAFTRNQEHLKGKTVYLGNLANTNNLNGWKQTQQPPPSQTSDPTKPFSVSGLRNHTYNPPPTLAVAEPPRGELVELPKFKLRRIAR